MKPAVAILLLLLPLAQVQAEYAIPSGRTISWYPAGLDVIGGIPTSHAHTTAITGLHPTNTTDDTATINAAILAAAGTDTVLTIPAGVYRIDGDINMKTGVILRGAQPATLPWMPAANVNATTLMMNGNKVFFRGGSRDTNWTPGIQQGYAITSGYTKGSTSLTLSDASALATNDYISVYQNKDTSQIEDKGNNYLGEDSGSDPHVWAQYTKITNVSGNVITIDPPLYQVTASPTGQSVRKQRFDISMSGLENLRLFGNGGNIKLIWMQFCKNCWITGVETYNVGANSSGSPHIWTEFCYANEYSGNYCHVGAGHDSGAGYGMEFYHWNSRHKIENNVVRETRHSIIFEGGGSGCVILYNYTDDNWESVQGSPTVPATDYLSEDTVANHGAHPYMNLWEGNYTANWWGDYTLGSSSYNTAFRNCFTGKRTAYTISSPYQWSVVEIEQYNRYYNIVGNILGNVSMTTGTVIDDDSAGTKPEIYRFGHSSNGGGYVDSQSYSTAILHGNYDFVSDSVHDWASADHALPASLYYTAKPSYFGKLAWPSYDYGAPTVAAIASIPAGYWYTQGVGPTPTPGPTPGPTPTPAPTPLPGVSLGITEMGEGSQRVSSGPKTGDFGTKAFPSNVALGHFIAVAGAVWGQTAPTSIVVTATCVATPLSVKLGNPLESKYLTFIARGLVTTAGPCTVKVDPGPTGFSHDFAFAMDPFAGVLGDDVDGGETALQNSNNSGGTMSDTITPVANALIIGVSTHGGTSQTPLSAAAGYTSFGEEENNAGCQAFEAVFKIGTTSSLYTVGTTYGAGIGDNKYYATQTYSFKPVPVEYVLPGVTVHHSPINGLRPLWP